MSDSEALESTLQTKLTHFEITQEKTGDALKTEKRSTIARHMETLKNTYRCTVEHARRAVEAQTIAALQKTTQEIKEWNGMLVWELKSCKQMKILKSLRNGCANRN